MKKQHFKNLKLAKKTISSLSLQKSIGGRTAKSCGTATCLICPTYATICPKCPSNITCSPAER
ncbi:hypothetical protein [uncultured Kordia sp.]|uniref:hypothetical protein n=1 Tax=uncultured Kordia sp. TaxID=507699 RepID=UPI002613EF6D|nr:hypothetical protein [uncultured Kordia sp.]